MTSAKRRNLLILKTDEQRFDTIAAAGHSVVKTPNLDRLHAQSASLTNAFTVSPLCVPSRTSFFTGNYPHANKAAYNHAWDHLDVGQCAMLQSLKDAGYRLGLAGKNHTFQDEVFDRFFDYREQAGHWGKEVGTITKTDRAVSKYLHDDPRPAYADSFAMLEGLIEGPMPFDETECPTHRIGDDAIAFLHDVGDDPFCLLTMFGDPHWPTVVPEPYYSMHDPADVDLEAAEHDFAGQPYKLFVQSRAYDWHRYADDEKRRILATYYGQISYVDAQVGRLLDALDELGLAGNTVVCFTSDHGSFAGRFGLVGKTCGFNDTLVRIPLMVRAPGVEPGPRGAMVSNIDVMPTLLQLIGLEPPADIQGRSLLPMLKDASAPGREAVFAEVGEPVRPPPPVDRNDYDTYAAGRRSEDGMFWFADIMRRGRAVMVRTDRWKFVHYTGDVCELYDLHDDPLETRNLAADPACQSQRNVMATMLFDWLLNEPWAAYRARHGDVIRDG